VFEERHGRQVARAWMVASVLAVLAAVVVVAATTRLLLDRAPRTDAVREPATTAPPQQIASRRAGDAVVRPVPKFPPAPIAAATKPGRGTSTSNRAPNAARRRAATEGTVKAPAPSKPATAEQDQQQLESLARDFVEGLRATGETAGIAAFPPPGTNPIKTGIVVPEEFELPPGYVRHYQTTDDGKRLDAILMFSPDYEFVDQRGEPIALPEDGIVPPEDAPPGMPLRMLEIPQADRTASTAPSAQRR
jgi:hypothetical protein